MSNINQRQVQKLLQKLSPQQIQMIKLLELPAVQLEQRVKQEIEENPVLEEEATEENDEQQTKEVSVEEYFAEDDTPRYKYHANNYSKDDQKRPVYLTEGMSFHENLIEQLGLEGVALLLQRDDLRLHIGILLLAHGQGADHVAQRGAERRDKGRRAAVGVITGARELLVGTEEQPGLLQMAARMIRSGDFYGNPKSQTCTEKYCPVFHGCRWRR